MNPNRASRRFWASIACGEAATGTCSLSHLLLPAVRDDGRPPRARSPRVDAVEIDEPDRLVAVLLIRRAVPQPAAHERQVRVGVARRLPPVDRDRLRTPLNRPARYGARKASRASIAAS